MKTRKILLTLITIIALLFSLSPKSFAAKNSVEDQSITSHTIVLSISAVSSEDDGIVPYIWGEFNPGTVSHNIYNTPSFYIPDRYFAYEVSATATNGSPVNENFSVALKYNSATKSIISGKANGSVYKNDWIDVVPGNYYFAVNNSTNSDLSIKITYYSW